MEFCAVWLRRNVPEHRSRISFVTGDCGQFLSEGPEVTAILDVEVGYLGDHLHDLACFRGRHPIENMGDLPALRSEEHTSELQSLMRISYAVFCLKKKNTMYNNKNYIYNTPNYAITNSEQISLNQYNMHCIR